MISAFAGFQQSANISALQPSKDVGNSTKDSAAPGARNVLTAMQGYDEGARQAFDKASSQIVTSFLDGLQNKIADEPVKGGNDAGSLTSLTSAEFINTLSVSANNSDDAGNSMSFDFEAYEGLSITMEETDGQLTSFNLDFEMSTSMAFEGTNANGGYQSAAYESLQTLSISFSLTEDEDGSVSAQYSFEQSVVTQVSYLSMSGQAAVETGTNADISDVAGAPEGRRPGGRPEGPPPGAGPPPGGGPPPTGGEGSGDLELDSALSLMEEIAEEALEEDEDEDAFDETFVDLTTSLFAETYYNTY